MSNFFINSSEILTISFLNNKSFYFNQEEMANAIGCTQPNISYVISSLIEKGIVENCKGFIMVNQYRLIEYLFFYAKAVYDSELYFSDGILKIRNWTTDIYAFFETYFRLFNIEYVVAECKAWKELSFVFSDNVIDISDIS